jgi:hypothetical protein
VVTDEVASALAKFFDRIGPSADEMGMAFKRERLDRFDPQIDSPKSLGKMRRVRGVLSEAMNADPEAAARLVKTLIGLVRAAGGFRPGSESFAGEDAVVALRDSLRLVGYDLDPEGGLRPTLMENLEGREMTDALRAYVRRARTGAADGAQVVGTSKDLTEAAARHVLVETTGAYPVNGNFPTTLYQAFDRLGLATPPHQSVTEALSGDTWESVEKALYLLGCAVNRYRQSDGQGHGRPHPSRATEQHGQIASQAAAVVTQVLLDALEPGDG